jgi:hypothetical protein
MSIFKKLVSLTVFLQLLQSCSSNFKRQDVDLSCLMLERTKGTYHSSISNALASELSKFASVELSPTKKDLKKPNCPLIVSAQSEFVEGNSSAGELYLWVYVKDENGKLVYSTNVSGIIFNRASILDSIIELSAEAVDELYFHFIEESS